MLKFQMLLTITKWPTSSTKPVRKPFKVIASNIRPYITQPFQQQGSLKDLYIFLRKIGMKLMNFQVGLWEALMYMSMYQALPLDFTSLHFMEGEVLSQNQWKKLGWLRFRSKMNPKASCVWKVTGSQRHYTNVLLGGEASSENVCHWRCDLERYMPLPDSSLPSLLPGHQDTSSFFLDNPSTMAFLPWNQPTRD